MFNCLQFISIRSSKCVKLVRISWLVELVKLEVSYSIG